MLLKALAKARSQGWDHPGDILSRVVTCSWEIHPLESPLLLFCVHLGHSSSDVFNQSMENKNNCGLSSLNNFSVF